MLARWRWLLARPGGRRASVVVAVGVVASRTEGAQSLSPLLLSECPVAHKAGNRYLQRHYAHKGVSRTGTSGSAVINSQRALRPGDIGFAGISLVPLFPAFEALTLLRRNRRQLAVRGRMLPATIGAAQLPSARWRFDPCL